MFKRCEIETEINELIINVSNGFDILASQNKDNILMNDAEQLAEIARLKNFIKDLSKFEESKNILIREKFVFDNLDDRWQKLAFTFYTTICEIDSKITNELEIEP